MNGKENLKNKYNKNKQKLNYKQKNWKIILEDIVEELKTFFL